MGPPVRWTGEAISASALTSSTVSALVWSSSTIGPIGCAATWLVSAAGSLCLGLAWEPQPPFADRVALDLVCAPAETKTGGEQKVLDPPLRRLIETQRPRGAQQLKRRIGGKAGVLRKSSFATDPRAGTMALAAILTPSTSSSRSRMTTSATRWRTTDPRCALAAARARLVAPRLVHWCHRQWPPARG